MIMNYNSWHARVYRKIYEPDGIEAMPNNICSYFWHWFFIVLFSPFLIVSIWTTFNKNHDKPSTLFAKIMVGFCMYVIYGISVAATKEFLGWTSGLLGFAIGPIVVIVSIVVLLILAIGFLYLLFVSATFIQETSERKTVVSEYIKSVKEKSCKLLTWNK